MNEAYQHHEQRVALQNAAEQPAQQTPRSHARGRGIRHLAEHGSIDYSPKPVNSYATSSSRLAHPGQDPREVYSWSGLPRSKRQGRVASK